VMAEDKADQIPFAASLAKGRKKVAVVTDSVAQVPKEIAEELDIHVLPFIVSIDGQDYHDGIDLLPAELYRRMRQEKVIPTTSAPSIGDYENAFMECMEAGAEAVACVVLSSTFSSGYNSACMAARLVKEKFPARKIEVIDSKLATIAQGFVAIEAAKEAQRGASLEEIIKKAKEVRQRVGLAASLETLEYLALGGRIGKASYLLGSLVQIIPVMTIDSEGVVTLLYKERGMQRSLKKIVEYVSSKEVEHEHLHLAIMHADAELQAAKLEEIAQEELNPAEVLHASFTPVMVAHTGPGLVGLAYYYEEKKAGFQ